MSINYLKTINKCELDKHITFDEKPHIYTINGDSNYKSVTSWNHSHFEKFNADNIIKKMMNSRNWENSKYFGMSKNNIKFKWEKEGKEASEAGTKMHYDIECFYNKINVSNDSTEFKYFLNFHNDNKNLKPYRTEWMIYDKELKLAGSIDMIFINDDGSLSICDWKRSKEIRKTNKWQSSTTECINHLEDCNFNHYSLQLNTYKYILENNYDEVISDMYLLCLHPINDNYLKIKVPDLSKEVNNLMKLRYTNLYNY